MTRKSRFDFPETQVIRVQDGKEEKYYDDDDEYEDEDYEEEDDDDEEEYVQRHHRPVRRKRRLSRGGRAILRIILAISIAVAGYSGFQLYMGLKEYRESENAYEALAGENASEGSETVATEEGQVLQYEKVNFEALAAINSDVAGWLSLEGTVINYPIVHGTDNEYYLEHLFNKETNHTGCIFIDADNAGDFSDKNTAMYAHHMRNGSMFAELENYREQSYYDSHKELVLQTPNGTYLIQPFAGILTDGYADYIRLSFGSTEEFLSFVDEVRSQSTFQSDVEVLMTDRIVTMSTCRYDVENGRYAVFGKLVPID
ncbi:MAG: class B sortase [Solobacterium sp.]|nr:class B sortase [Solobacterium sp.]